MEPYIRSDQEEIFIRHFLNYSHQIDFKAIYLIQFRKHKKNYKNAHVFNNEDKNT